MTRSLSLLAAAALFAACSQQAPQPPPGFVVGPNGVMMPGVSVGPGGITAPGVSVGPGGISAPGVSVGPGGISAPGVAISPNGTITTPGITVSPTGVAAPGVPPAVAPPADAPPSTGIAECDGYVQRACSCPNEVARGMLCQAARSAVTAWQGALSAGADRAMITQSCQSAAGTLAMSCPQ